MTFLQCEGLRGDVTFEIILAERWWCHLMISWDVTGHCGLVMTNPKSGCRQRTHPQTCHGQLLALTLSHQGRLKVLCEFVAIFFIIFVLKIMVPSQLRLLIVHCKDIGGKYMSMYCTVYSKSTFVVCKVIKINTTWRYKTTSVYM